MAKKQVKKKRNKRYQGEESVPEKPVVHKYEAIKKSKIREYYEDNKVRLIRNGIFGLLLLGLLWLFVWLF